MPTCGVVSHMDPLIPPVTRRISPTLTTPPMQWCDCDAAPVSLRQALIKRVVQSAPTPHKRVTLTDVDAGLLKQTNLQVEALVAAGHRDLRINLTEPFFPKDACGAYTWERARFRHQAAQPDPCAVTVGGWMGDRLAVKTQRSLDAFLLCSGERAITHDLRLQVHVHRSVGGLHAAVAQGLTHMGDLITGVDLQSRSLTDVRFCNEVEGQDAAGIFRIGFGLDNHRHVWRSQDPAPNGRLLHATHVEDLLGSFAELPLSAEAFSQAAKQLPGVTVLGHHDNPALRLQSVFEVASEHAEGFMLTHRRTTRLRRRTHPAF